MSSAPIAPRAAARPKATGSLPNFVIIGAMKAATTTLCAVLQRHPEVFVARGEPQFFLDPDCAAHLPDYQRHFSNVAGQRAIGEKSPGYCYVPGVAERIRALLPEARIVFMLREPVARAYSNYWHRVSRGKERLSFAQAVARERSGHRNNLWQMYLKRSLYAEQAERYLTVFPRDQIAFVLFEDMRARPRDTVSGICRFLGVRDDVDLDFARHAHVTHVPRSRLLARAEWRLRRMPFGDALRAFNRPATGYPPLEAGLAAELGAYFAPHNERLAVLTGLDLSSWRREADGAA